ncbi:MAG TPA: hypothetical protein VH278_09790 [Burkholderiaceae bacterium]|jgi:hypothetical protein|nr:hypothetical protein [Burkholderiaceae bacterium]
METITATDITWSLTRTGALVRAQARGHVFGGEWFERSAEVDAEQGEAGYSVTHCARCGAALFAESAKVDDAANPALDAECPDVQVDSQCRIYRLPVGSRRPAY